MDIAVKNPRQCSNAELDIFESLVHQGGEVTQTGFRNLLRRAKILVFINDEEGTCVAVGAIKNPRPEYKTKVFRKAMALGEDQYSHELGWLYVHESARRSGYGSALMKTITASPLARRCFATTREKNASMISLFQKYGFEKLGNPFKSSEGDYYLALYANTIK